MHVLKFGGTSLGSAAAMKNVKEIVQKYLVKQRLIIVASAMGGTTDLLIEAGRKAAEQNEQYKEILKKIEFLHLETIKELFPIQDQRHILSFTKSLCNELEDLVNGIFMLNELSTRTLDRLMSFGELMSSRILAALFALDSKHSIWKDARAFIKTNDQYGNAAIDFTTTNRRLKELLLEDAHLIIIPGFIGSGPDQSTTTLGRGGSDYTAAIVAAGVDADIMEIWTDVSGIMTADPRWVSNAKPIPAISYKEAMELSHFGAKVIYPPTIQPVLNKNIPVWIKNTFSPSDPGTIIHNESSGGNETIKGISSIHDIALLSLEGSGMVGIPGFSKRLFEALAQEKINVILITQSSSEHSICVAVASSSAEKAMLAIDEAFEREIALGIIDPLFIEKELSIVALVGENMKSHPGISGKMFGTFGRNGINVRAIAQGSSERNISAVISTDDVRKAVNVLHEEFFETSFKQINLFIAGVGNVGKRLLAQIKQQHAFLMEHLRVQIHVVGLINSRKMVFTEEGIKGNWEEQLEQGEDAHLDIFVDRIVSRNLRNTVFVDVTAHDEVANTYASFLQKSIAVVACNKIAAASAYANYAHLKFLAREYNTKFLFETNVGAGLPVIGTLNDLLRSGDDILKIEAVLSGTLNYVFNNYDGSRKFSEVVKQAQDEGYTEPDPRLDLSGTDVARKIMILARESGEKIEIDSIENISFLPPSCMKGSVADFYVELEKHETHFRTLYDEAVAKKNKLKFVATYSKGKASVGLQHINEQHDFYHLYGKDNIVRFTTNRYPDQPLVVKGAGAGADVTASGVFADILRSIG
ncbi:MAG: bifunctional aspartate kinase/homoserine dehydrogenase I [Chitinophagaceae bacterium]